MNSKEREKRFNKTKDCELYLTKQGYKVQSLWECEFFQLLKKTIPYKLLLIKTVRYFIKNTKIKLL